MKLNRVRVTFFEVKPERSPCCVQLFRLTNFIYATGQLPTPTFHWCGIGKLMKYLIYILHNLSKLRYLLRVLKVFKYSYGLWSSELKKKTKTRSKAGGAIINQIYIHNLITIGWNDVYKTSVYSSFIMSRSCRLRSMHRPVFDRIIIRAEEHTAAFSSSATRTVYPKFQCSFII